MPEPNKPQRSMPSEQRELSRSSLSVWLALGVGLLIVAVLAAIVMLAMGAPPLAAAIAIGGGVFALAGLQYLLWGWWLGPKLRRDAERDAP
ncbi:MAG: hypothetical protein WD875_08035 [Pirellulales bacterium]